MNREQKAERVAEIASAIKESEAVFAVDYRGLSVPQIGELRTRIVHEEDWAHAWKAHFPVLRVGARLVVRPMFRIRNSRAFWSVKPPPVLVPNCLSDCSICS